MADATLRSAVGLNTRQAKVERAATVLDSTYVLTTGATAGTQIVFARIPTNARIHGLSQISWDDCATTGSPTLDLGFKAVDSNFTTDTDALNDGLTLETATTAAKVIKDHKDSGKKVWELLGLSSDPGGLADVIGTTADASTNQTGDVTLTLVYSVD